MVGPVSISSTQWQWRRQQAFTGGAKGGQQDSGGGQQDSGGGGQQDSGGGATCAAISTQTWTPVKSLTIYSIFDIRIGVGLGTLGSSSRKICTGSRLRCVGTLCENRKHSIKSNIVIK